MGAADVAAFERLISMVASVAVVVGSGFDFDPGRKKNNTVLAAERDATAVRDLRSALQVQSEGERYDWMTPGEPTLALYDEAGGLLGTVTCLLPDLIRTETLDGDARLVTPEALVAWLATHGWTKGGG